MVGRKRGNVFGSLACGRDRFEAWRRARKPGARIPGPLWSLAVKLVEAHGLSRTASVLRLDYYSLKKRVAASSSDLISGLPFSTAVNKPDSFIEVSASSLAGSGTLAGRGECVVEFADGSGASLRVHLRGCDVPDVVALGRSFWSGE